MLYTLPWAILLSLLVAATCSGDDDAARPMRKVFAHYMVCIPTAGGGATIEDYKREILEPRSGASTASP